MDVVYLFFYGENVIIPFYRYDFKLFQKLLLSQLGTWNRDRRHYVFPRKYADRIVTQVLSGYSCVRINQIPAVPAGGMQGQPPENPAAPSGPAPLPPLRAPAALPSGETNPHPSQGNPDRTTALAGNPPQGAGNADAASDPVPGAALDNGAVRTPVRENYAPRDDTRCLAASQAHPDLFSPSWQEKLATELHAGKYSRKTIQAYLHYNKAFCRTLHKRPEDVRPGDIKAYLAYLDRTLDLSASSINLALSSLKFFYTRVLKRDVAQEQHRPRQDKRLPVVLSKAEVEHILKEEKNPKHRLLLMLAYSSGLRVSEVVALKKEDIDFARKAVLIRLAKGRKDRYTLLSERAALFIKDYCALYGINSWLFPGHAAHRPLSIRSAQNIFEKALRNAGIHKIASIHNLRHTFATHLLESGTDIKYIQALMGHVSLRTTERYTHVAHRHVLRIQSPLDTVFDDL
jgi:site-specific recombinase XerD